MRLVTLITLTLFVTTTFAQESAVEGQRRVNGFNKMIREGGDEESRTHQEFLVLINGLKTKQSLELQEPDDDVSTQQIFEVVQRQPASLSFKYLPAEFSIVLIPKRKN